MYAAHKLIAVLAMASVVQGFLAPRPRECTISFAALLSLVLLNEKS